MDSTAGDDSWPDPGTDFAPAPAQPSPPHQGPPHQGPPHQSPPTSSDDSRVDEALRPLAQLADRPVGEHVEVYDDVQRQLQDILGSLDGG